MSKMQRLVNLLAISIILCGVAATASAGVIGSNAERGGDTCSKN